MTFKNLIQDVNLFLIWGWSNVIFRMVKLVRMYIPGKAMIGQLV